MALTAYRVYKPMKVIAAKAHEIMGWGAHIGTCSDCGESAVMGDTGICEACALSQAVEMDVICHHCFEQLPACRSCGNQFTATSRKEVYCPGCLILVKKGRCPHCKKRTTKVDDELKCPVCSREAYVHESSSMDEREWCELCGVNEVEKTGDLCASCEPRRVKCPHCKIRFMKATDYICGHCLGSRYGYNDT